MAERLQFRGRSTVVDVVQALQASMEIVGKLRALNKKVGEADFKMLLAELTDALGDAKLEAANLKIEMARLQEENRRLSAAFDQRSSSEPELDQGAYVFGEGGRHYCTGCYDVSGRKVLVNELTGHWTAFGKWECPACNKTFGPATV